jgi:hypothetical protein
LDAGYPITLHYQNNKQGPVGGKNTQDTEQWADSTIWGNLDNTNTNRRRVVAQGQEQHPCMESTQLPYNNNIMNKWGLNAKQKNQYTLIAAAVLNYLNKPNTVWGRRIRGQLPQQFYKLETQSPQNKQITQLQEPPTQETHWRKAVQLEKINIYNKTKRTVNDATIIQACK